MDTITAMVEQVMSCKKLQKPMCMQNKNLSERVKVESVALSPFLTKNSSLLVEITHCLNPKV